jgi:hypothetical protein
MGMFGNILIIVIAINILLAVVGVASPNESLIANLISPTAGVGDFFKGLLNELLNTSSASFWLSALAVVGSLIYAAATKRDDAIYLPLIIMLVNVLGIFNFIQYIFPANMMIVGTIIKALAIVLFSWSAVEWLRGVER